MNMKKTIISTLMLVSVFATASFADVSPTPAPSIAPVVAVSSTNPTVDNLKWVNDKLQVALADTLTKATMVAGDAKDFVVKELPDVIKQLLLWKFWQSLAPMIFWFLMTIFLIRLFCNTTIKNGDWTSNGLEDYKRGPKNGFPSLFMGIVKAITALISVILFLHAYNWTWLQIWLAPKVYLIDYARSMVIK